MTIGRSILASTLPHVYAALAVFAAVPAVAAPFDMRDCPLDRVTFVDPWSGASFAVGKVGTNYNWLCPEGEKPEGGGCEGPFGDLVLEGEYRPSEAADGSTMTAVWTVIKAAPCCNWSVQDGRSPVVGNQDFKWLASPDMPLLRSLQLLSIEAGQHGSDFGQPLHAAVCDLP